MARKIFATILKEIQEAPEDLRADILRNNDSVPLRSLLKDFLDPSVVFDVEVPSYRETNEVDGYSANSLYVEYRRLYIFKTTETRVSPERKKALLAQILESIDYSDAYVLIDIIKKDAAKYGLTKELVNEAFPDLIP